MICSLSHDARMPGKQDALAPVQMLAAIRCNSTAIPVFPAAALFDRKPFPANAARNRFVKAVSSVVYVAKVAQPVIRSVMVDVINYFWLFVVGKKPSKSMCKPFLFAQCNTEIAVGMPVRVDSITRLNAVGSCHLPRKQSRFRIVIKDITDRVWNNLCSHFESPLNLVRGLTVGAVSTPILSKNTCNLNMRLLNG